MPYDQQRVTYHDPAPYFNPPRDSGLTREEMTAASSEASRREMAYIDALNRPAGPTLTAEMIELKQPALPKDFGQRVEALDNKIYERGVAVDHDALLSLGKARFQELLAADREARSERVIATPTDLTSWPSVCYAFAQAGAFQNLPVPQRSTNDQLCGAHIEVDDARKVEGFHDLWKFYGSEPRAVGYVDAFHDQFVRLAFGQSLFTWIEDNGQIHHKFFCGGSGEKVRLFEAWLPALKGSYYRAKITNALQSVVFWLAGEKSQPPDARDWAKEWFGIRVPQPEQIKLAQAVCDGFALGRRDWLLWVGVGAVIRKPPDRYALNAWHDQLRKHYRSIEAFHRDITAFFWEPIGDHREFEPARHRAFINRTIENLRNIVSAVVGLTIEENLPKEAAPVAARFRDWILLCTKPKAKIGERIREKLSAAFPGATFNVQIEKVYAKVQS